MTKEKTAGVDLTVVVPVYNEAGSLPDFLPELLRACKARKWRLIFVNDGSRDDTARILSGLEGMPFVKVLNHTVNRGYGGALKTGIAFAGTRYMVTIDADGQHDISDIDVLYRFAVENNADLVVGNRGITNNSDLFRGMGKSLIRGFTRLLVPLPIRDLNSGFKFYKTSLAKKYARICPNTMAFSDVITLTFVNRGNVVLEHPISVRKRTAGKSTIGIHTAFETVFEVLNIAMLFNPLKVFLPISFLSILAGLVWGIPIMLLGRGVSVGAMLAIVLGALFFVLGLIASQLAAIRMDLLERSLPEHEARD